VLNIVTMSVIVGSILTCMRLTLL